MRASLIIASLLIISFSSLCQDKPVPDYVTKQHFPDSVGSVTLLKVDGSRIKLSDVLATFRGKKVMVDIWASWCRDCIVGLPKLNKLKEATGEEHVAYVFISVDEDDAKWRTAISRFNIRGEHYRIEAGWKNPLANYIVLDWVPRYLTLDEQGRVIMPKAIVADDEGFVKSLGTSVPRP